MSKSEHTAASKAVKNKYREQGLCTDCGDNPLVTKNHCEPCRTKHAPAGRKRAASRRASRRALGLCIDCAKPRLPDSLTCGGCQERKSSWARDTYADMKKRCVSWFGGACAHCGFITDVLAVYDFHHLDPSKKDFNLARLSTTVDWEKVVAELSKCVMLCANCHRTHHAQEKQATCHSGQSTPRSQTRLQTRM